MWFANRYANRNEVVRDLSDPTGKTLESRPKSEFDAVCDFCGAVSVPLNTHTAADIELYDGQWSKGDWAGCDACSLFIDKMDKDGLLTRCVDTYTKIIGAEMPRDAIVWMVGVSHDAFWKARAV